MSWQTARKPDLTSYRVEMFQLRVPEPLVYEPPPAKAAPRPKSTARRSSSPRTIEAPAPASAAEAPELRKATRGFTAPPAIVLPEQAMKNPNLPVILQPEYKPQAPKTLSVPAIAAWGNEFRPKRQFVAPGRKEPQAAPPQFAATPELAMPNKAQGAGNLNLNLPQPEIPRPPALPVAAASTTPVRTAERNADPKVGAIESVQGDPANLIAITPMRLPPGTIVNVPAGLRNIPPPGDPNAAAGSQGGATGAGAADSRSGSGEGNGKGSAANAGSGTGNEHGPGGPGSRTPGTGSGTGSGSGSGKGAPSSSGSGSGLGTVVPPASATQGPIRVTRPPTGSFDVVITQSTARIDLSTLGASLSGTPVYSVYLPVGGEREWLLEYCLPAPEKPKNNPYEVFVDNPAVIAPPFPIETSIPRSLGTQPTAQNVVFHGFLTAGGAFRGMALRSPDAPVAREIFALLGGWRFRPAAKDGKATEIEVLLVVPGKQ